MSVQPSASRRGSLKSMSSVSFVVCRTWLANVMTERYAVSSACGSPRSSDKSALIPWRTASIGSPIIDPEQSKSKYTGSLRPTSAMKNTSQNPSARKKRRKP